MKNQKNIMGRERGLTMLLGFTKENEDLTSMATGELIEWIRRELNANTRPLKSSKRVKLSNLSKEDLSDVARKINNADEIVRNGKFTILGNPYENVKCIVPIHTRIRPVITLLIWSASDNVLSSGLREAYIQLKKINNLKGKTEDLEKRLKNFISHSSDLLGFQAGVFMGSHRTFGQQSASGFLDDIIAENLRIATELKNGKWDTQILFDRYILPKRAGRIYYPNCIELLYQILRKFEEGTQKEQAKLALGKINGIYDLLDHPSFILNDVRKMRIKKEMNLNDPSFEYLKIRGLLAFLNLISTQ